MSFSGKRLLRLCVRRILFDQMHARETIIVLLRNEFDLLLRNVREGMIVKTVSEYTNFIYRKIYRSQLHTSETKHIVFIYN